MTAYEALNYNVPVKVVLQHSNSEILNNNIKDIGLKQDGEKVRRAPEL